MATKRRSQAQKRLALESLSEGGAAVGAIGLDRLTAALEPYVEGALETLGKEAAAGNVQAAKAILDFLSSVAREEHGSRGVEILRKIAEIRGASPTTSSTASPQVSTQQTNA